LVIICLDVQNYGFFGLDTAGKPNDVASQWMNKTLAKPTLNITAFYLGPNSGVYGYSWTDPRTKVQPFSNGSNSALFSSPSNATYSIDYIQQNGVCQPTGVRILLM